MKKIIYAVIIMLFLAILLIAEKSETKPEHLSLETFKEKVFDFEADKKWKFKGEIPAIIDFYADWCGPCKQVAPIMEELAQEFDGKVKIYKIDTDQEKQLAGMFGIRSIPSILFIPVEGQPQMVTGALPIETFKEIIEDVLKVK